MGNSALANHISDSWNILVCETTDSAMLWRVDLLFLLSNKTLCNFFQVSLQKQLSQYFRSQRRVSKPCKSSESGGSVEPKPYKKARLASTACDDDIAQRQNLELRSNTEEGSLSTKTFSNLVKETYPMRRKFITEEAQSSKEILDKCPYFGKSTRVSLSSGPSFWKGG